MTMACIGVSSGESSCFISLLFACFLTLGISASEQFYLATQLPPPRIRDSGARLQAHVPSPRRGSKCLQSIAGGEGVLGTSNDLDVAPVPG